jgi:dTDP-4-amino-4,6-dideoxygalactose transaminase
MEQRKDYIAFGKPDFSEAEIDAVARVLRTGWIGMGPEVIAFESELAGFVDAPHVVSVNTCTSALFLSLAASGVGPGDEVIVPSFTWCATANVALYLGAKPVFCDVDPRTFCATPESIARRVGPKTKAAIVVHYGGHAADVAAIRAALPPQVTLVEDAAHALGARYADGRPVGASGNLTCFSFYANKNLSTGEGGAIALSDPKVAEHLRSLRQNALVADAWKRFTHPETALIPGVRELGYKMNFTDLQACLGRVQLRRQAEFAARRIAVARRYSQALATMPSVSRVQRDILDERHARHLYVLALDVERLGLSRNQVLLALRERKVGAAVHYAPLHTMPFYQAIDPVRLEVTEDLDKRVLTLPIGPSVTENDADYVLGTLRSLTTQSAPSSRARSA